MIMRFIRWLFAFPGYCSDCKEKNKVIYGPTFEIEYCPVCNKRS